MRDENEYDAPPDIRGMTYPFEKFFEGVENKDVQLNRK
jgi:hypothetical protein